MSGNKLGARISPLILCNSFGAHFAVENRELSGVEKTIRVYVRRCKGFLAFNHLGTGVFGIGRVLYKFGYTGIFLDLGCTLPPVVKTIFGKGVDCSGSSFGDHIYLYS